MGPPEHLQAFERALSPEARQIATDAQVVKAASDLQDELNCCAGARGGDEATDPGRFQLFGSGRVWSRQFAFENFTSGLCLQALKAGDAVEAVFEEDGCSPRSLKTLCWASPDCLCGAGKAGRKGACLQQSPGMMNKTEQRRFTARNWYSGVVDKLNADGSIEVGASL